MSTVGVTHNIKSIVTGIYCGMCKCNLNWEYMPPVSPFPTHSKIYFNLGSMKNCNPLSKKP